MALKPTPTDWQKFVNYSMDQQDIAEFQKKLAALTGRELYDLETLSLMNKFLINRPISYSLHRTKINYPIQPMETMKACLLDGVVFLRIEDATHMRIDRQAVSGVWNLDGSVLESVEIRFIFIRDTQEFTHLERWKRTSTGAHQIVYKPIKGNIVDEKQLKVDYEIDYPFFPFVGIRWIDGESFLEPLSDAVIRLEAAYRVIAVENIDRMGLALYLEGVRDVNDIKSAPRKMGRRVHILPKDTKFHSPVSDTAGLDLMLAELENLNTAIEKASGVVSTEKLASLSGVSRQIAENPLIILSDEIRNRFAEGMQEAVDVARIVTPSAPLLELSFRPIKYIEDTAKHMALLDKAIERGAITTEEEIQELRLLLDLD